MATKLNVKPAFLKIKPINQEILGFLQALWSRKSDLDGFLVLWGKKKGESVSFHVRDLEPAAGSANCIKETGDAYVSVGLQRTKLPRDKRGDQKGVVALPGFWFDFDVWNSKRGGNRPKEKYPQTKDDVIRFMENHLPRPTILIDTGGGYHGLWLFKEPIVISSKEDLKETRALTTNWHKRIAELANPFGWQFDNVSSVEHLVRIPGTINHKYNSPVTRVDLPEQHYSQEELLKFIEGRPEMPPVAEGSLIKPELMGLVDACAFLKHCQQDAASLSEPEWHMMVCILAQQDGGSDVIHHLSEPHSEYTVEETERKIENARKNNPGPITCEHLKTLWDCGRDCGVTCPIHLLQPPARTVNPFKLQAQEEEDPELDEDIELDILKDRFPDARFPWKVFPDSMTTCLKDLAEALAVQDDMTAAIALAVISSAMGSAVSCVESKPGYAVPTNIWLGIIGETGHKKTPTLEKLLHPVYQYQKNKVDHAQETGDQDQDKQNETDVLAKALRQVLGSVKQPKNPKNKAVTVKPESVYTTDTTIEALLTLLCENPKGILVYQDELSGFLLSFNKYRGGKGNDREQYLSLWSGTPIKVDRVEKQLYCHRPFLSILGGIQPSKAAMVFGHHSFDDGMLPRFLFYQIPGRKIQLTDHTWAQENEEFWKRLILDFYQLQPESLTLKLDREAWNRFKGEANSMQRLSEYVPARVRVFIPKLENYILRLAGILHMINQREKENLSSVIPANTLGDAITLARFFLAQARQVVQLYGPSKMILDRNQEMMIEAILTLMEKLHSSTIAVSDIMNEFNTLVPDEGKITSDKRFGALLVKILKNLNIDFKKTRKQKNSGNLAMHLEITDSAKNKLLKLQATYKNITV